MTSPHPPRRQRATALAAAITLGVLVLPATASADDGGDADVSAERLTTDACDDQLVRFSPTGTEGDDRAASIVAQAFDADAPGWTFVAWEAAPGTQITTVVVERGGALVMDRRPGATHGTEEAVHALTLCGHRDATEAATPEPQEPEASVAASSTRPDEDETTTGTDAVPHDAAPAPATERTAARSGSADPASSPDAPGPTTSSELPTPVPATDPDPAGPTSQAPSEADRGPAPAPADTELTHAPATELPAAPVTTAMPVAATTTEFVVASAGEPRLVAADRRERDPFPVGVTAALGALAGALVLRSARNRPAEVR
jgi:hypothetical protein